MKLIPIESSVFHWANRQFRNRDIASRLRKLGEESGELSEAAARWYLNPSERNREAMVEEAADCALVLADMCALLTASLTDEMEKKMAKLLLAEKTPHPQEPDNG